MAWSVCPDKGGELTTETAHGQQSWTERADPARIVPTTQGSGRPDAIKNQGSTLDGPRSADAAGHAEKTLS